MYIGVIDEKKLTAAAGETDGQTVISGGSVMNLPTQIKQEKKKKCPHCPRTYDCEDKLLRHVRYYHNGENPYQCTFCDYSTYNSVLYRDHINIHKGIKPYKCTYCPYRCVSKKNLQVHEKRHRPDNPLSCKEKGCSFFAKNKNVLKAHVKKEHMDGNGGKTQMLKCKKCGFESNIHELYAEHQHFACSVCKKVFYSRNIYSNHTEACNKKKLKAHKKKKDKRLPSSFTFTCAVCKWPTNSKQKALLHLIHHPKQVVDTAELDISILIENGIMS